MNLLIYYNQFAGVIQYLFKHFFWKRLDMNLSLAFSVRLSYNNPCFAFFEAAYAPVVQWI
uniref:Uncharacterized protein n=1 Tax=Paenibacillus athensensis TaxID=1967502 RepID=A0A4Y8PZI4_9BACL